MNDKDVHLSLNKASVLACISACAAVSMLAAPTSMGTFNIENYGALGNGQTLNSVAINKAIDAASNAGGGLVYFPPGTWLSGSIHLKNNVTLYLEQGATLLATSDPQAYDEPEPNQWDKYQDFGHSHFHNSLIWGEGLHDVAVLGTGRIYGKGLTRDERQPRRGNKAISLKLCRNVTLKDFTIQQGGWFGILATGIDNLTIDNLKIDTNRDGMDIDSCRNVHISNSSVNSPYDDGICLKADYSLGFFRDVENVTITNCLVTGFDEGTFLDGTYQTSHFKNSKEGPTGRIKCGTESSSGFKNIAISNSVFNHCRGLALETVDGGHLEDVTISNVTMRDIVNSPIFLRLGSRLRSPAGTPVGGLRRVNISNFLVYDADPRFASIISGIPGHDIEDVKLNNIRIFYKGGGTKEQAALTPPENEQAYPEPGMFGDMPAYGFFIRHVRDIQINNVEVSYVNPDQRPAFILEKVTHAEFDEVQGEHAADVPALIARNVNGLTIYHSPFTTDTKLAIVKDQRF